MVLLWVACHKVIWLNAGEESGLEHDSFHWLRHISCFKLEFVEFKFECSIPNSFSLYYSDASSNRTDSSQGTTNRFLMYKSFWTFCANLCSNTPYDINIQKQVAFKFHVYIYIARVHFYCTLHFHSCFRNWNDMFLSGIFRSKMDITLQQSEGELQKLNFYWVVIMLFMPNVSGKFLSF
jgi:hypothetical protein